MSPLERSQEIQDAQAEHEEGMTPDPETKVEDDRRAAPETGTLHVLTGRLVGLQFLLAALRRARPVWMGLGLVGLLAGACYHFVVPIESSATATLYLAHTTGAASTAQGQGDLAMLDTPTVGHRAIALLGRQGDGLTPTSLLGKTPGALSGPNILTLRVSGPTRQAAVHRVDAVAKAYLAFRAQVYEKQNQALVAASTRQLTGLHAHIAKLDGQIAALGSQASPQQLAGLQAQVAIATTRVVNLEQAISQSNLETLSIVHGSRVISPGTIVPTSTAKAVVFDGLTGMVGGLGVGIAAVLAVALLSDKVRRREDLAALVGAPIGVSVGRACRRFTRLGTLLASPERWRRPVAIVAHYLREQIIGAGPRTAHLLVAIDDVKAPAAALAAVAARLRASGQRVVVVDETGARALGRALHRQRPGLQSVELGDESVTLLLPPQPWEEELDKDWLPILDDIADPDEVLVVATVDPAIGAWHLRRWATDAVLTVTAGAATTHRIAAVAELLDAAGITISSAVLFNADAADESAGLPVADIATAADRLEVVQAAGAAAT